MLQGDTRVEEAPLARVQIDVVRVTPPRRLRQPKPTVEEVVRAVYLLACA